VTYTSGIENSEQLSSGPSISSVATLAIPGSARTEAVTRAASSQSSAIDQIASDSARVSLAGIMLSQASLGSDVRFDKVAALRQTIEAGSYSIPSANIAGKLIDSLQQ
jgi:flagellar biosynthesis anti-sigma factor FlgM